MWGSVCFCVLMEGRASCELNFGGQESLPYSPQGDFHYRDVTDTCLMGTDPLPHTAHTWSGLAGDREWC